MHSPEAVGSGTVLCVVLLIHWRAWTTLEYFLFFFPEYRD